MVSDIAAIFREAYKAIQPNLTAAQLELLASTEVAIVTSHELGRSLGRSSAVRVPAYYNPNDHTIYLNKSILAHTTAKKIFNICYHELTHATSYHHTWQEGRASYFQSGLKLEVYRGAAYSCHHRALNEGVVQFLTNAETQGLEPAYQDEVTCIAFMMMVIGITVVKQTLAQGSLHRLEETFHAHFGDNTFQTFSRLLDKKEYHAAQQLLAQKTFVYQTPIAEPAYADA